MRGGATHTLIDALGVKQPVKIRWRHDMKSNDYLSVAARIGHRLVEQAQWRDQACTWTIQRSRGASADIELASGEIYQGSSGIALFLGELFRHTGENSFQRTARGAMTHALRSADRIPEEHFGFYSGRVGIATAAARLGGLLDRPEFVDAAGALLENLSGREQLDQGLDVMAGAGGAIPALIELRELLDSDLPLDIAGGLGEHLIRTACREPGGWSWPVFQNATFRNLTGFSHGAAGIALALLELARVTGRDRYRFAAEMAFLYERQFFDETRENWLDLRHTQIGKLQPEGVEAVRKAALSGAIEPYQPSFMTAWCHGSPGIGLTRLRAFELTGQDCYREEAKLALRSTLASLDGHQLPSDFSLCHGVAGNCELPLEAASAFGQPELRRLCEWLGELGRETFELKQRPWPCGTVGQRNDPSLMLGEAGIGYFYLRLYSSEVPSLLLPRPTPAVEPEDSGRSEEFFALCRETVHEYFGATLLALHHAEGGPPLPRLDIAAPIAESPVEATYNRLKRLVGAARGSGKADLEHTFSLDRQRYEMTLELGDFTDEYLHYLTRPSWQEATAGKARFRPADHCRLIDVGHLLFRRDNRIQSREVDPLTEAVLRALPGTLAEVANRVTKWIEPDNRMKPEDLIQLVEGQIEQLYQAGLVDAETVPTPQLEVPAAEGSEASIAS